MTIAQTGTTSFKVELYQMVHNFGPTTPDTFKVALYTSAATLSAATTAYTTTGEVVGTAYVAGGADLVISTFPSSGLNSAGVPTAFVSFNSVQWINATLTARGALIYNSSKSNKSVCVLDFGSDKTVEDATIQILFPAADATSAVVRIS